MNRNDRGEYTERATDKDILAHFTRTDRPVQTAQSVAQQFGLDRSQAYRRLQQLADDGALEKAKVGGRAVVWWISETPEIQGVNPEDPIFERSTFEAGEPEDTSENIDEILYGDRTSGST